MKSLLITAFNDFSLIAVAYTLSLWESYLDEAPAEAARVPWDLRCALARKACCLALSHGSCPVSSNLKDPPNDVSDP